MSAFLEVSVADRCVNRCAYCPQDLYVSRYKDSQKFMPLNNYKAAIDKLPAGSEVAFAGFCEPGTHPDIVEMVHYAYFRGHSIRFATTLMGLDIKKYQALCHVQYAYFALHLPDSEGKTRIAITDGYKELLRYVFAHQPNHIDIHHHRADLHESIRDIVPWSHVSIIYDRAGNLVSEDIRAIYRKGSIRCNHVFMYQYPDGGGLMLPNGDVYLCCSDFGLENHLGNLFYNSWEDIKQSRTMQSVYLNNINGRDTICRKCWHSIKI